MRFLLRPPGFLIRTRGFLLRSPGSRRCRVPVLLPVVALLTAALPPPGAETAGPRLPPAVRTAEAFPPAAGPDVGAGAFAERDGGPVWPVAGRPAVLRGWEPPAGPYGPGHRGVDLAARPGTEVLAAATGRRLVRGAGGGARGARHRAGRERSAPAAHDVRAGAGAGGEGRRRGRGPAGRRAGSGAVPLCGGLSALGAAAGRCIPRPALAVAVRASAARPVTAAAGLRGARTGSGGGSGGRPAQPRTPRRIIATAVSAMMPGSSATVSSIRRTAASTDP